MKTNRYGFILVDPETEFYKISIFDTVLMERSKGVQEDLFNCYI